MKYLTPKRRRFAYDVAAALLGVAAVYGLVSGEQSHAILLAFSALFGVARTHVSAD